MVEETVEHKARRYLVTRFSWEQLEDSRKFCYAQKKVHQGPPTETKPKDGGGKKQALQRSANNR
jgi:hypothetical protein